MTKTKKTDNLHKFRHTNKSKVEMFSISHIDIFDGDGNYDNSLIQFDLPSQYDTQEFYFVYGYLNSIGAGFDSIPQFTRDMIRGFANLIIAVASASKFAGDMTQEKEEHLDLYE